MDTPEKTKITTPLSKFEDSPVFNYINSLSPIKPVKSIHITQTFQSLSFSSLPSIFTSPHVTSHKESRFLKRHNNSDPSKPEFSSGNGNKVTDHEGALEIARFYGNSSELRESFDPRVSVSVGEASVVPPPSKHVHFATELPQNLKYDCGSPESDPTPRCGPQVDCISKLDGISASEICRKSLPEGETNLQEMYQSEQKTEATDSDWENLITDAADLLIFNSPIDSETFKGLMQRSVDPHEVREIQMDPLGSGEDEFEYPSTQPGETVEQNEINRTWESFATSNNAHKGMTSNPSEEPENEMEMSREMVVSNLHRGMRRRCLDFEVVGARRKNLSDNSNSSASNGVQSDEMMASKSKQPMPVNPGGDSSRRRVLPGIGLHLNALTITSKDSKNVKIEALSSEISLHSPGASFHSPTTGQELIESLTLACEPEKDPTENGVLLLEDVSQTSTCLTTEEFNHNSPKKKRRKLDGEIEGCKRCNCKKSKCLKLYCECFAAGVYCIEPCSCQECFNKPIHEDTVLSTRKQIESRNPLAFAPKVIRGSESVVEIGDDSNNNKTPASARHKRGCNCKKSNCLKKYCECYQGGVGCSINCRCEGCKNAFGRKDGSAPPETEAEAEEETEGEENHGAEKASQKIEIQNNEEHNPNTIPVTPLSVSRPLLRLPFSSKGKPPRSFLGIGSSSGLYTNQKYGKPNILRPEQKFEKQLQTVPDDDIPEILRDNYSSPSTGIKTSPNGKRVSPPHSIIRSGRKLILQSIPSFPSLTPHH